MNISKSAKNIRPFLVMDILEAANKMASSGSDVIHLEVGEPDFDTPECIIDAALKATREGKTHYTHSLGIPELRVAISEHYKSTYNVDTDPDQVLVTAGSSAALMVAFAILLDKDSEVIMSDPHYACYPNFAEIFSAKVVRITTLSDDLFQLNPVKVKNAITPKTKAILINSPANPTGAVLDDPHIKDISSCGPIVISDEIYHGLVYKGIPHTILEYTDNAIVINGFSKAYAMTGWRLGWAVLPKELIRTAQKIHQNLMICAPSISQWAGIAALREASLDVKEMRKVFARRRKIMLGEMARQGFNVEVEPTGAFYVLVNMKHISHNSHKLAFDILKNTGVGVTPGIDFGPSAEGYIRFSYANSKEKILSGIDRVGKYLKSL
ncbi:MAG: pyridoxal phosphate-dependent aminotransferase [Thermodesulfobacteriota bacterium]|nr:pyridoxal phosphate-dependent aminotransferase [Thermodesulfobacteriota bacterium]